MKLFVIPAIFLIIIQLSEGGPLRLQKRAAFYIANETACVVDNTVYSSGDPIPTDDPCEACKCRPPGFACVLKECETKPGCRAVRRAGHCCPEYICDSDNSSTPEYAFSTKKEHNFDETTINPQTIQYSELPEKSNTQETKIEAEKESSEAVIPPILDSAILFSANEDKDSNSNVHTTKKDITTESYVETGSNDDASLEAESSEDNSSEKQTEGVTDLLKTVFEVLNDEEKHKETESSSESSPTELNVDHSTSVIPNANAELFPTAAPTIKEVKTEHTGDLTTISNTSELPDKDDDLDAKANELVKKFRSLENVTSEDEIQSITTEGKEVTESNKFKDAESTETKLFDHSETSEVTEKTTSVYRDSIEENNFKDSKSSTNDHTSTEATIKPDKLYYNSEEKEITVAVETVTTLIQVKEQTSSDKDIEETSTPVSNDAEQLLFKALNDVIEAGDKLETTEKSDEIVTIRETFKASDSSTIKVIDEVSTSPSSVTSETDEQEKKSELYGAEDSKIASSTETHKVTDAENDTTVPEVSSQKVEEQAKE
ncbi:uncharacterized protein NPIL_649042 [Nephila pilipes]|uniref:VWFC domain-containing protein n=1 Tax=Nephila pilipes TaxID=299642 RepID=A0A8X6TL57_NEPPI|nr:uncharacterized protein NPIL_649042 [Nephila pilipes]